MGLPSYAGFSQPYVNIAKYLSPYDNATTGNAVINVANGDHVSGEAKYTIWGRPGVVLEAGDYIATWTGTGTVAGQWSPATITIGPTDDSITFGVSGQIQGLSIIKEGATGTYTDTFAYRANRGNCIRFMDAWRTNDHPSGYDAANPWVRIYDPTGDNEFRHKLLTPTDVANIGKDHSVDIWICLNHLSTDQNITDIATAINATGFAGTVYVEHSNEVWNNFPVNAYAKTQLAGYGGPGEAQNIQAWHADETHRMGGIFKATIPTAVVVFGCQLAVPNFYESSIDYALTTLTNIDAVAVGSYFGGPWSRRQAASTILDLTDQQVADAAELDFETRVKPLVLAYQTEANGRGHRVLAYEAGSHLDHADADAEAHLAAASNGAPMGQVYTRFLDWWETTIDDLCCLYQDVGNPDDPWSHIPGELGTHSPRWEAYLVRAE
jgi:hypothetical protein